MNIKEQNTKGTTLTDLDSMQELIKKPDYIKDRNGLPMEHTKLIPDVIKATARFCTWKNEEWNGKIVRTPYNPVTHEKADVRDPNTFVDYQTALNYSGGYDGLGIGTFDDLGVITIKDCIENGELSDLAKDAICTVNSYTEMTLDNTGIQIFFRASNKIFNSQDYLAENKNYGIYISVPGMTNHWIPITGQQCEGLRTYGFNKSDLFYLLESYMRKDMDLLPPPEKFLTPNKGESEENDGGGKQKANGAESPLMIKGKKWECKAPKPASEFEDAPTAFSWYPYLPIGDYSVIMAPAGTGKTYLCCAIAAAFSSGKPLPGDEFENDGQTVLFISAEDEGSTLKMRLAASGAELSKVFIIDKEDSVGLNFLKDYDSLARMLEDIKPVLVVIDPWHAFLDSGININQVNEVREVTRNISLLAKRFECSIILVSHVNKKAQSTDLNFSALGSVDLISASRSAFYVLKDPSDEDCRTMVPTKSNYAKMGKALSYKITADGGVEWGDFVDVTKETIERAYRNGTSVKQEALPTKIDNTIRDNIIRCVKDMADQDKTVAVSYDEMYEKYGNSVFAYARQPKRVLDKVVPILASEGYKLETGKCVNWKGKSRNGFKITKISSQISETETTEQLGIEDTNDSKK